MTKRICLSAALFLLLPGAVAAQASTLSPERCGADAPRSMRCMTLAVPLDREGGVAGSLNLPVQILRSRPGTPDRGPLVMLNGGPGQAGVDPETAAVFRQLGRGYDIVTFDQRGTGRTALRCAALDGNDDEPERIDGSVSETTRSFARCAAQIGPARRFYTSADSAADIDQLRAALGAERIAIGGTSYGTWVSQVYARMYPERVTKLILDSTVGPEGVAGIALSEYAGARRVIRRQCARGACKGILSRPLNSVAKLVRRLNSKPVRGRVVTDAGRTRPAAVGGPANPGLLTALLYAGDLTPDLRAAFPAAVGSALRGDTALLMRLLGGDEDDEEAEDPAEISEALFAATSCAESVLPWAGSDGFAERGRALESAISALKPAQLAPWGAVGVRTGAIVSGCLRWPDSPFTGVPTGPLPDVPALILNGLDDVRTPVEDARAVAAQLPRATVVPIPNQGHSVFGQGCAQSALRRFLAGRPVSTRICADTPETELVPLPPRSIAAVGPNRPGPRARANRTARATAMTVWDALTFTDIFEGAPIFPGLRGGLAGLRSPERAPAVVMRSYVYVPGLKLSGRLRVGGRLQGRLRVAGSRAAAGLLTVRNGVARGRLGGRPVALRIGS